MDVDKAGECQRPRFAGMNRKSSLWCDKGMGRRVFADSSRKGRRLPRLPARVTDYRAPGRNRRFIIGYRGKAEW